MIDEKVRNLLENGYEFHTGDYIREGWDLFKKNAGGFVLYLFIYVILTFVLSKIPFVGPYTGFIVGLPLIFGFYIVADKAKHGEIIDFGDFFKGFSKVVPFFFTTIITDCICFLLPGIYILYLVHGIPDAQQLVTIFKDTPSTLGITLLLMIPGIFFGICFSFAPFLIYFRNYNPLDAIATSFKIIIKQWFAFLILNLLFILIIILGTLCLIIGLFAAVPMMYCAKYAVFNDIVGARETPMENNIADHLITA